jgi:ubiquinone/menaquinone biosynthesis C-methylase UbiE
MLKIGKKRIEVLNGNTSSISFLRADAFNMPFKDNSVQTVLSFGVLHIFDDPSGLILEFNRILKPNGQLSITCLCTDRKFSEKYLNFLHKKGHVSKPMGSMKIGRIIAENGFKIMKSKVKGGMMYITAQKQNRDV